MTGVFPMVSQCVHIAKSQSILTDQKDKTVPYDYPNVKGDAQPGSIRNSQEQLSASINCTGPLADPQSSEDSGRIDGSNWFKRRK